MLSVNIFKESVADVKNYCTFAPIQALAAIVRSTAVKKYISMD